jgi:UDP-2,4-diacetamido-2,4,6-trideoxy-beta-L-altropyranose hydrolase
MNVVFRADASVRIGSGHLMRCLTLAGIMRNRGADVLFVCRDLPGNLCRLVEERGFRMQRLPRPLLDDQTGGPVTGSYLPPELDLQADAAETATILSAESKRNIRGIDLLVVDHYALDFNWEEKMRPWARSIMAIDDLADRRHDCDILLDQNYYGNLGDRYQNLLPDRCVRLLGPAYALLRPEFHRERQRQRKRDGTVRQILIFFGGSDPSNETGKALRAIQLLGKADIAVEVVVGAGNPHQDQIRQLCCDIPGASFHCQIDNMSELVAGADLAIGAGGTAMWERCYLGLPSLVVVIAANQLQPVLAAAGAGAVISVGLKELLRPDKLAQHLQELLSRPDRLREVSDNAWKLIGRQVDRPDDLLMSLLMGNRYAQS